MSINCFLTGSRVYGTPTMDSDVDLVVLTDPATAVFLAAFSEGKPSGEKFMNFRFGKLNLIICTEQSDFDKWRKGTELLEGMKPVSRDQACKVLKAILGEE